MSRYPCDDGRMCFVQCPQCVERDQERERLNVLARRNPMTAPDARPTMPGVSEAEVEAAMHAYLQTGMSFWGWENAVRAALQAAALVRAGHDGEVEHIDRLTSFLGFVRTWVHRETPPNAVNPITDEMRLDAIKHHPMLNGTDACLAGLARDREIRDLTARATQAEQTVERMREVLRPFAEAGGKNWLDNDGYEAGDDACIQRWSTDLTMGDLRRAAALADPATDTAGAGAGEVRP